MLFFDALDFSLSGEQPFYFDGQVGKVEAVLAVPQTVTHPDAIAIVGHPHSLFGGTMDNKVVTSVVKTFKNLGVANIRLNFRGVGGSAGVFDHGVGESADVLNLIALLAQQTPHFKRLFLAGFSFGSYVMYRTALDCPACTQLICIAPPVVNFDFASLNVPTCPWVVLQGDADEVVAPEAVYRWVNSFSSPPVCISFPEVGHFFHGHLLQLQEQLRDVLLLD